MKRIENLSKSYGEKTLFQNLSYEFPDRGCVLIRGDSGAGKTTLLRILAGLEKADEGSAGGFAGKCAVAFQEYRLFPQLTALANVTEVSFGDRVTAEQTEAAKALLLRLGFTGEDMKKRPDQLSGGMKQRVNLARALLSEKEVLLLDEPTKELNDELAQKVRQMMKEEGERRLVVLVSHSEKDLETFGENVVRL